MKAKILTLLLVMNKMTGSKTCPGLYTAIMMSFIMAAGPAFRAQADCHVTIFPTLSGSAFNSTYGPVTNFSCFAGQGMKAQFLANSNGCYAYCEFDRSVKGTPGQWPDAWVYEICHESGVAIDQNFWAGGPYGVEAICDANIMWQDLVAVQYIPDSATDAPPTSISFQQKFWVQGQITSDYVQPTGIGTLVGVDPGGYYVPLNYPRELNVPAVAFSFGSAVLCPTISVPIAYSGPAVPGSLPSSANATTITSYLKLESIWADPAYVTTNAVDFSGYYASYTQPNLYNVSSYFLGYTNIVDQNNNPVAVNKLLFWLVDPNKTSAAAMTMNPDLSQEQSVPLQAIQTTNGLTIQWPLYASNYQLQTTGDLLNGPWTTNSLPTAIQVGTLLQVTVPMTNHSGFFRLVQMN